MKKIISKTLIFILSIQLLMPHFGGSFAQEVSKCEINPPVCGATPDTMMLYLDFQREVAALIQTSPFKTANETVSEGEGGIFTNELLKLEALKNFDDSLAGQALKLFYAANIRSATALITSAFLFELAAFSTLADNSVGLTILFQDRPIVRDRAKLLDVERNLNQTAYHLGQAGEIAKTISDTASLKQLLKSYEAKGLLVETEGFTTSLRYMDLISLLAKSNITLKSFLAYDSTFLLKSFQEQGLKFSEKWIQQLDEDYRCTRWTMGFKCSTSWESLINALSHLVRSTENQGTSSRKTIQQASKNLVAALLQFPGGARSNIKGQSSDAYLTEREKALLRDVYGLDTTKMTKEETYSILYLSNKTKEQWRNVAKAVEVGGNTVISSSKQAIKVLGEKKTWQKFGDKFAGLVPAPVRYTGRTISRVKKQFNRPSSEVVRDIQNDNRLFSPQLETLNYQMVSNLQALAVSRLESEMLVASTENLVLTHQVGELSVAIKRLIDSIGNKEKNLRKTLNNICSYQAANKGNAGCYVP